MKLIKTLLGIFSSLIIFVVTTVVLLKFLPNSHEVRRSDTEIKSEFKKYVSSYDVVFKKIEEDLENDESVEKSSGPHQILGSDEIVQKSAFVDRFSMFDKEYVKRNVRNTIKKTGDVIYDQDYLFEGLWRRVGEPKKDKNSDLALVFIGCSFTLGEGLPYKDSMAGMFEKAYPQIDVYNYSKSGGALNEHLYSIETGAHDLLKTKSKKIILIYTYIPDHLKRETCRFSCLSQSEFWKQDKPYYKITKNGLSYTGTHKEQYFFADFLGKIMNKEIGRIFSLFDEYKVEEGKIRHKLIMKELHSQIGKNKNLLKAYALLGSGNDRNDINEEAERLVETEFTPIIIDYAFNFKKGLQPYHIKYDGHPSARANRASFNAIQENLEKDFPEIFKNQINVRR